MQTILNKLICFDDFLKESTNVENFPLLKGELMKYKNMDPNKIGVKLMKHVFLILGSKDHFDSIFNFQNIHRNQIREKGKILLDLFLEKKYDIELLPILTEYMQACIGYKKESDGDALKHYFYGYCECDVVGSSHTQAYYYQMLEIQLQYLRSRIMNDIITIRGIKGMEELKTFLEGYKYNGVLYYTNEKELIDQSVELFWTQFDASDGIPYMAPLIEHFKLEYSKITSKHKEHINDTLDPEIMSQNLSLQKNDIDTVLSNVLQYLDFIAEQMVEIDAAAQDSTVLGFHDKLLEDIGEGRPATGTVKEFFIYVFDRLKAIYQLKRFVQDNKNKNI